MLLTLIIYEPHWLDAIDSQVRSVMRQIEYRHVTNHRASTVFRLDYLHIVHEDGEIEKYRLWNETQFYVLPYEPVESHA